MYISRSRSLSLSIYIYLIIYIDIREKGLFGSTHTHAHDLRYMNRWMSFADLLLIFQVTLVLGSLLGSRDLAKNSFTTARRSRGCGNAFNFSNSGAQHVFFFFWKVGCDLLRGSLRVVGVMSHAHPLGDYVDCNPSWGIFGRRFVELYRGNTWTFVWLQFWDTQCHQHVLKQVSACKVVASRQISSNLFAIFGVDPTIWYAVIWFSSRYSTMKQYCCCFSYVVSLVWLLSSRKKVQRQKKRQGQALEICKHVWTTLLWAWKAPIVADAADAPVPPVDDAIAAEPAVDDTIAAEVPVADAIAAEVPSAESLAHCPRIGRTCCSQLCFSWRS